jgi:hypothetical protein
MRERIERDTFINKIRPIDTATGRNLFSEGGRTDSYQIFIGIKASEVIVKRNGPDDYQQPLKKSWRRRCRKRREELETE